MLTDRETCSEASNERRDREPRPPASPTRGTYLQQVTALRRDPAAHYSLTSAVDNFDRRDPVDAANAAEYLLGLQLARLEELGIPAPDAPQGPTPARPGTVRFTLLTAEAALEAALDYVPTPVRPNAGLAGKIERALAEVRSELADGC
jgi:hypothetical protein